MDLLDTAAGSRPGGEWVVIATASWPPCLRPRPIPPGPREAAHICPHSTDRWGAPHHSRTKPNSSPAIRCLLPKGVPPTTPITTFCCPQKPFQAPFHLPFGQAGLLPPQDSTSVFHMLTFDS